MMIRFPINGDPDRWYDDEEMPRREVDEDGEWERHTDK